MGTIGTARAQYHLRQTFVFLNMFPINQPEVMIDNAASRFDAERNLKDDKTKGYIRRSSRATTHSRRRVSRKPNPWLARGNAC
jgi:chromate reductase